MEEVHRFTRGDAGGELACDLVRVVEPLLGLETRVVQHFGAAEELAEQLPLLLGEHVDTDVAVGGGKDEGGSGVAVRVPLLDLAVVLVVEGGDECAAEGGFLGADIDVLAAAV